jgi:hypothetical protein
VVFVMFVGIVLHICRWVVCEVDYLLDWGGRNGVGLVWVAVCFFFCFGGA